MGLCIHPHKTSSSVHRIINLIGVVWVVAVRKFSKSQISLMPTCLHWRWSRTDSLCVHNRCFVYITLVFRSKFVWLRMASKRNYNGQQQQQPTTTTITATALAKHAGQLIYCRRKAFRQCGLGSFTMAMHSITTKSQQIPFRRLNWKSESDWASKRQTGGRKWRTDQMLCISRFIWRTDLISLYHEHFKQWFGHYFVIMYH